MRKIYFNITLITIVIAVAVSVFFQLTQSGYKNYHRGLIHYNRGNYLKAAQYFEKVSEKQPQYPDSLFYLVMSYDKSDQKVKLAETLEKLSRIEQHNLQNIEWLGDTYYSIKRYDLAEKYYQKYLEQEPKNYRVRRKLAEVLTWQNNYEKAIPILQSLQREKPRDNETKELLADAYSWSKNYDQAIKLYKELLEEKSDRELVLKLAEALRFAGKDSEAIDLYNKYIYGKNNQ